jgi:radical SAM superfamily enzyme YgiQ (UPF0313 family)
MLMRNRIATASINVLTPYPGTRVFDHMQSQGRLLTKDWRYYDHSCVVFRPSPMTPLQLLEGHQRTCMEFYKLSSIARRLNQRRVLSLACNLDGDGVCRT